MPKIVMIVCCVLLVGIITTSIIISLVVRGEETCSETADFHDLPNEFWVSQNFFSNRDRATIYDKDKKTIGSYTHKPLGTDTKYRYRDHTDNVVGKADKSPFSLKFKISACRSNVNTNNYELQQYWLSFGEVKYDLLKNNQKIGTPTKNTWFTCNPDIALDDNNGTVMAIIERSCGESWFRDKWHVVNYQPKLVDNYVLGFIAYITTQKEQEESEARNRRQQQQQSSNNH